MTVICLLSPRGGRVGQNQLPDSPSGSFCLPTEPSFALIDRGTSFYTPVPRISVQVQLQDPEILGPQAGGSFRRYS